ncbi:MAG: PTS sugar transporter subunit IIA [Clostridium sp.]|uniref:PTS sugar transporter subunit IIA n=1 Tax=Clostridium sp. TaxID=1506 RepID=UPI002906EEE7|nr:PTS sugar transporter subunit IIA [Clostridium sp.]MDU5109799.1 PTS sugar transporter subunit IIA [Clostridium sp.]
MDISKLINVHTIKLELEAKDKIDVISQLADMLDKDGTLKDKDRFIQDVLDREKEYTTGVGREIAIPHGKSEGVKSTSIALARLKNSVDWKSLDDNPVKLVFLLAVKKEDECEMHLRILSKIAVNLMEDEFVERLFTAKDEEEILKIINQIN